MSSNEYPVLLLKSFIILPNQEVKLEVNNEISKAVIDLAYQKTAKKIFVICPLNQKEEEPDVNDLPNIGVLSLIESKIELPNKNFRISLKGMERVAVIEYENNLEDKRVLTSIVTQVALPKFDNLEEEALKRKLFELLNNYINMSPGLSDSIVNKVQKAKSLFSLTDTVTSFLPLKIERKLYYMQEINAIYRARALIEDINLEIEILKLDEKIEESLQHELDQSQKEFILKEKLKEIKKELKEDDFQEEEVNSFKRKLTSLDLARETKQNLHHEITKYSLIAPTSPEMAMIRNYIDTVLSLPWHLYSKDETDLKKIRKVLDQSHYGLDEVKDRIIEYMAVKIRNEAITSPILCFIGPPGVGKSTLASSIAEALKRKFAKISVGGLNDPGELIGHRRTYIGSSPGKIINALKKGETANPVILIDEVDKMAKDIKGDPASALLDVLDKEQNKYFLDNYIDEPFDLSKVLFILTANKEDNIPEALKDRLELIYLSSYTEFQKVDIANNYLLPLIYQEHKITNEIKINQECLKSIINNYTKESGVRELNRNLAKVVRKIITESYLNLKEIKVNLKQIDLEKYLGAKKYEVEANKTKKNSGLVNGLAYTEFGGLVMLVEACMYDGTGKVTFTGCLGDIMKESIEVALSYLKANTQIFEINEKFFSSKDIHLHFLEGAIKKDGPSGGVAIVSSLISLFTKKRLARNIAMTGEITLNGDILKVGGIKEKLIGAYNGNIKKVFLPQENIADLIEVDEKIKNNIEMIPVSNYLEIYDNLFKVE